MQMQVRHFYANLWFSSNEDDESWARLYVNGVEISRTSSLVNQLLGLDDEGYKVSWLESMDIREGALNVSTQGEISMQIKQYIGKLRISGIETERKAMEEKDKEDVVANATGAQGTRVDIPGTSGVKKRTVNIRETDWEKECKHLDKKLKRQTTQTIKMREHIKKICGMLKKDGVTVINERGVDAK
ncbi:hypothetical protein M9H77_03118 [Catharanthus roseus]|uniref:Uncharacterized protein n=1 Tax=Catharanthus roseus TaxID=4058 RepID=A0ACC0CAC2_CATRO|nr:hypothetical protein M9H77_03118 [Catharanthus roseus]